MFSVRKELNFEILFRQISCYKGLTKGHKHTVHHYNKHMHNKNNIFNLHQMYVLMYSNHKDEPTKDICIIF
jgi:hypothetical protein